MPNASLLIICLLHGFFLWIAAVGWGLAIGPSRKTATYLFSIGLSCLLILHGLNIFIFHFPSQIYIPLILFPGVIFFGTKSGISSIRQNFSSQSKFSRAWFLLSVFIFVSYFVCLVWFTLFPGFEFHDDIAYLTHLRMILERADLIDPFSNRRLSSYGGHPLLASIFLVFQPLEFAQLFEIGLINLVICALCIGILGDSLSKRLSFALVFAVLSMSFFLSAQFRIGLTANTTLVLFFYAWLSGLSDSLRLRNYDGKSALQMSLLLTAICSSRASNIFFACLFLIFFLLSALCRKDRELSRFVVRIGFLTVLLCLPMAYGLYQSSETFLFPLFPGNAIETGEFGFWKSRPLIESLMFIGLVFIRSGAWVLFLCLWQSFKKSRFLPLLASTSTLLTLFILSFFVGHDVESCAKYVFPFIFASFLFCFVSELKSENSSSTPRHILFFGSFALSLTLMYQSKEVVQNFLHFGGNSTKEIIQSHQLSSQSLRLLQNLVPPKEKILSFVEAPYLFDLQRNGIHNLDNLGASSPGRVLRNFSPQSFEPQFRSMGYQWFIFEDPLSATNLYSHRKWEREIRSWDSLTETNPFVLIDLKAKQTVWDLRRPKYQGIFQYFMEKDKKADYIRKEGPYSLIRLDSQIQ